MGLVKFGNRPQYSRLSDGVNSKTGGDPDFEQYIKITLADLLEFEYNATNFLYDLPPPQKNLFFAKLYDPLDLLSINPGHDINETGSSQFPTSNFRIKKIDFGFPKLTFEEDKQTHIAFIKDISLNRDVSISWIEDVYNTVTLYHANWIKSWFNVAIRAIPTGKEGKFRNCDIISYHYINTGSQGDAGSAYIQVPMIEPLYLIQLRELKPTNIQNLTYNMDDPGSSEDVTMNYRFEHCEIFTYGSNPIYLTKEEGTAATKLTHDVQKKNLIDAAKVIEWVSTGLAW